MSLLQVREALELFATEAEDKAIVLKGDWGTGKTHLWKQVVLQKRDSFHKQNYSYVSLFGLGSLKDLKRTIYENKLSRDRAHQPSDMNTFNENIKDLNGVAGSWFRKTSSLLGGLSAFGVRGVGPLVESLQFFRVTDTLICIDDFERKGASLSDREVLGLISLLVESKNCRVVMLLNDDSIKKGDEYFSYNEKVFNYEIKYAPSVEETCGLVFDGADGYERRVIDNVKKLNINNVRMLRKIKYFTNLTRPFLVDSPSEIMDEAAKVIPLALYAKYGGGSAIVDIEYVASYRGGMSILAPDKNYIASKEEKEAEASEIRRSEFLNEYGYRLADELSLNIIDLVKNGYVNSTSLVQLVESIARTVQLAKDRQSFSDVWHIFHNDISFPSEVLLEKFEDAVRVCSDNLGVFDLDGVYSIFKESGEEGRGKKIVDEYFVVLSETRSLVSWNEIYNMPQSEYVLGKLNMYFDEAEQTYTLDELVELFFHKSRMSDVLSKLSVVSSEEYCKYFKMLPSTKFVSYVRSLLILGTYMGGDENQRCYDAIFVASFRAVLLIADESPVMKLRMNKFMTYESLYDAKIRGGGDF